MKKELNNFREKIFNNMNKNELYKLCDYLRFFTFNKYLIFHFFSIKIFNKEMKKLLLKEKNQTFGVLLFLENLFINWMSKIMLLNLINQINLVSKEIQTHFSLLQE